MLLSRVTLGVWSTLFGWLLLLVYEKWPLGGAFLCLALTKETSYILEQTDSSPVDVMSRAWTPGCG